MASLVDTVGEQAEETLWTELRGESAETVRQRLFARHVGFAASLARRYHRKRNFGDLDLRDVQQLAYAGLLEAIDRFDPAYGVPFRGYAARRVVGSMASGVARMSEVNDQLAARARSQRDRVRSLARRRAEPASTAEAVGELAELAVGLALGMMLEGTGLYVDGDAAALRRPTAYDSMAWRDLTARLEREVGLLPGREQLILRHHYLDNIGFDQLALLLGLSKSRISQLHRGALVLLRKRLGQGGDFDLSS